MLHPAPSSNKIQIRALLAGTFVVLGIHSAKATDLTTSMQCREAAEQAERGLHIPEGFLSAMSRVESGRRGTDGKISAWPWTVNAAGVGYHYESKQEAIAAVEEFQRQGVHSIDIGCLQVNIMHHPDAFRDLNSAFDPITNSAYAGKFLNQLFDKMGSWPRAAAAYHSQTPGVGEPYQWKVLEAWAIPEDGNGRVDPTTPKGRHSSSPVEMASNQPQQNETAQPITPFRAFRPFSGGQQFSTPPTHRSDKYGTGRTLASYRAFPTRMASAVPRAQVY